MSCLSYNKATFAGGCFWCMVQPFDKIDGIIEVEVGYTGGYTDNPSYNEICAGKTGHYEAVRVTYDPKKVPYELLLDTFWHQINPTDGSGQFHDRGEQYQTAIFYHNKDQKALAEKSKQALEKSGRFSTPIVTEILECSKFYPAEDYHQDYYKKNPEQYNQYKIGSGRSKYIEDTWNSKPKFTPLERGVTQGSKIENSFNDNNWNNGEIVSLVDTPTSKPVLNP